MESDSIGVLLPKVVLPYLRQWADHSGFEALSKLLVDEQFLSLIQRYADQFIPQAKANGNGAYVNGSAGRNGNGDNGTDGERHAYRAAPPPRSPRAPEQPDLSELHARVDAMEGQLLAQQAMLEVLRAKIRPLAQALGCCPECVVGLEQCPRCFGRSAVGRFEPDRELLRALVLEPLAARGVPLSMRGESATRSRRRAQGNSKSKTRLGGKTDA
jgi:hypothetical protein